MDLRLPPVPDDEQAADAWPAVRVVAGNPGRRRRQVAVGLCLLAMIAMGVAMRHLPAQRRVAAFVAPADDTSEAGTGAAPASADGFLVRWLDRLGGQPIDFRQGLCLQGLVVSRERPVAIVNQIILGVGDKADVPVARRQVAVECLAISLHGVTVGPEGQAPITLKMGEHSL